MASRIRQLIILVASVLLAACASGPTPPSVSRQSAPPRDTVTASAIERVLEGDQRSADNRYCDGRLL